MVLHIKKFEFFINFYKKMVKQNNVKNDNFDSFVINLGDEEPKIKGQITNADTGNIESCSFGETFEYEYTSKEELKTFSNTFKNV